MCHALLLAHELAHCPVHHMVERNAIRSTTVMIYQGNNIRSQASVTAGQSTVPARLCVHHFHVHLVPSVSEKGCSALWLTDRTDAQCPVTVFVINSNTVQTRLGNWV